MWLKIVILILLLMVFVQDMKSRSVHWVLFPLLAIAFFLSRTATQGFGELWPAALTIISFLLIQFVIICAWFSLRNGKWTNITAGLLGWGDILFLLSIAFGLSVFSFLFFYIISLALVALYWAVFQTVSKRRGTPVPLAGLQALLLACVLSADWLMFHIDFSNDDWVFNLIAP